MDSAICTHTTKKNELPLKVIHVKWARIFHSSSFSDLIFFSLAQYFTLIYSSRRNTHCEEWISMYALSEFGINQSKDYHQFSQNQLLRENLCVFEAYGSVASASNMHTYPWKKKRKRPEPHIFLLVLFAFYLK